ncbi:HEAT repeat-containing protein 1-like isoform X2 [Dendronephthya gigantea]|uniref:HEAT repeat-containing protein 1-like isoform X2 n=1 Tax=Dendronephthya gigantea TaxID=151771 RepID=UPI00106DB0D7|nr:HEAT repeat-containing protein 1-like isoform X2 [Dendronephthya gigantea]
MSSLEKQLKRLRIPDSSSLERATKFKKKTSFLFDPKEASDIDNETVFALALNGLEELKLVNLEFERFETLLFSESSKLLERSLQSQELNDKLDSNIKDYLRFLSQYILLKPAHKTLEWLIRRYQVHLYNIDDLLACVFPYHKTNLFARIVQLINLTDTKWSWLISVQKTGSPLPHSTIIQHCISNPAFFTFISGLVFDVCKTSSDTNQNFVAFHGFSAFYMSTVIGVLDRLDKISEEIVTSVLAQIIHGLKSNVPDLQAASYMIIGQLTTKCELESSVIKSLLKIMCKNSSVQLSKSLVECISILCSSHKLVELPKVVYQTLCKLPNMGTLVSDLSERYEIDSFLKVVIFHLIKMSMDGESVYESQLLNLLKDIDVNKTTRMEVIRHLLNEYIQRRSRETDVAKFECSVKSMVKIIQNRWQEEMDKTIQDYLVSLQNEEMSKNDKKQYLQWTQDFVSMALSNIGSQVVCDSGSTLLIALHHPEAEYRKLALKKVSDILKEPMRDVEDYNFLKESLLVKLHDDDPSVVSAVLELNEGLINVCGGDLLISPLVKLMEKSSRKWSDVFEKAIDVFLSDEMFKRLSCTKDAILFYVLPFLFLKKNSLDRAKIALDRLLKSQLKAQCMVKSLRKKRLIEEVGKYTADSTLQELATTNAKIIYVLVEGMNILNNPSAFEMIKEMQDHANQTQNQTFVIMFLMICCQYVNNCKDEDQRFAVIFLFLPGLLTLVASVTQNDKITKSVTDSDSVVTSQEDCGIVPIGLLTNYLHVLKRKKERKLLYVTSKMYLYVLENAVKCLPQAQQQSSIWWKITDVNEEQYTMTLVSVVDVMFKGLVEGQQFLLHDEFKSCFETIVKAQFSHRLQFLKFLTLLWSSTSWQKSSSDPSDLPVPSAIVVVQSLNVAKFLIPSLNEQNIEEITSEKSQVLPSLLVCLTSPITAIRQSAVEVLSLIMSRSTNKTASVHLGNIVCESSEEIIADRTFVASVFQRSLTLDSKSSDSSGRRKSKSKKHSTAQNMLHYLLDHIVEKATPIYVSRALIATLNKVDSEDILIVCHGTMKQRVGNVLKSADYSVDDSQMLLYYIQKFTPRTAGILKSEPRLLEILLQLLRLSKPLFPGLKTPQEAVLNQITTEFFEAIDDENIQSRVLGELIDVLTETSDHKMSAKIKDVLKQLPITADQIQNEISKLLGEEKPKMKESKTKPEDVAVWSTSFGPLWQRVIAIIEVLQSKDDVDQVESLLPILFKLLSMCLEMSPEVSADYIKQLLLSTMFRICQAHVDQKKGVLSESHFSVEQVIRCIRVSENPQTHHHALSLLAIGAQLFPEKVLHNVMSIFTFMGMSVLRQDDTYSFQVIKRTVESIIPALIQAEKNERNLESLVTKVMRVFVDAFPHVPEHRRLPVFSHLLTTLGASRYLHICLALLLEKISNKETKIDKKESGLVFCNFLCCEFSPEIQMLSLINLLKYLAMLPEEKPEGKNRKRYADSSGIVFDLNTHSGKELHQFKFCAIEVILSVLGTDNLLNKTENITEEKDDSAENFYLSLLEESLKYITFISRALESNVQETTVKYLRVLLHKVYHIVEKVCDLLPRAAFVSIVSQLVQGKNSLIRKKSMDLFNKRMAKHSGHCSAEEVGVLLSFLDAIMPLIQNTDEPDVNIQSAFNTVVVLSKLLNENHNLPLKKMFPVAVEVISCSNVKAQVASSALHCLAELCSVLKVHSIPFLPKFLPLVLQILETKGIEKRSDLLSLNALTVLQKVVKSLPNFLSPYLKIMILQLVSPAFISIDEDMTNANSHWNKQIVDLGASLRTDIAVLVKPRILIPNVSQCYEEIVVNKNNESLNALYEILDSCITHMTKDDVNNYHNELLSLFVSALDYRSQHAQGVPEEKVLKTEETIIGAFISLIMRLSESLFRPMFLKLVDWATRSSAAKSRQLVFYHLADRMADKLKGLFVLFAGYLVKNTASILDSTNITKTESFFSGEYWDDEATEKSDQLLGYVLDCFYKCFLYDNQRFVNKERFDRLLQPLVDQIENQIGNAEVFNNRISDHLAPCIAQFAVAAGDETYWKTMNHQICLKTRHSSPQVRLAALKVLQELNQKLGEEYLALLPEIIPFLAELMEDESFEVEQKCQQVISEMEEVLGESLQKYF